MLWFLSLKTLSGSKKGNNHWNSDNRNGAPENYAEWTKPTSKGNKLCGSVYITFPTQQTVEMESSKSVVYRCRWLWGERDSGVMEQLCVPTTEVAAWTYTWDKLHRTKHTRTHRHTCTGGTRINGTAQRPPSQFRLMLQTCMMAGGPGRGGE